MSASTRPEGLAEVLRQLVVLGSGAPADEQEVAAGQEEGSEPAGRGAGCEKNESKERMSGISLRPRSRRSG